MSVNTLPENSEILSLLPHRGKMLLLSRVTSCDLVSRTLAGEYDITEDCLFFDAAAGGMPAWAAFECMAQAACALGGMAGREQGRKQDREQSQEPKPGFLLSVSKMEIRIPLLKAGATLRLRVAEDGQSDSVLTFTAKAFLESAQAASAKITVLELRDITQTAPQERR
jgi:predicted hotdog family 3-hydroxylacyl-ACP dehydratase